MRIDVRSVPGQKTAQTMVSKSMVRPVNLGQKEVRSPSLALKPLGTSGGSPGKCVPCIRLHRTRPQEFATI